jgi:hypothetical protein
LDFIRGITTRYTTLFKPADNGDSEGGYDGGNFSAGFTIKYSTGERWILTLMALANDRAVDVDILLEWNVIKFLNFWAVMSKKQKELEYKMQAELNRAKRGRA